MKKQLIAITGALVLSIAGFVGSVTGKTVDTKSKNTASSVAATHSTSVKNSNTKENVSSKAIIKVSSPVKKMSYSKSYKKSKKRVAYRGSRSAAKSWIAYKESGNNYNARSASGTYIGKYQLHRSYLKGDYSPSNQERVADRYVKNRYGSWANAKAAWLKKGWY